MVTNNLYQPIIQCKSTDLVKTGVKTLTSDETINSELKNGNPVFCMDTKDLYLYDEENKTLVLQKKVLYEGSIFNTFRYYVHATTYGFKE